MILNVMFSEKDWRKNWNKNIRLHKKNRWFLFLFFLATCSTNISTHF